MLPGELARLATEWGLSFDERSVLERLLLLVDHRTATLGSFTLTGLARQMGLGASSGRRTLRRYLQRLGAAGAVTWSAGADSPGRLEVTAYGILVHQGRQDPRRGFVQLVPGALDALVARKCLSPTGAALLVRLALLVDQRDGTVAAPDVAALGELVGLGTLRASQALAELVDAGLALRPAGGRVAVPSYRQFVRLAEGGDSARSTPRRAAPAGERAAPSVSARDPQESLHAQDQDHVHKTPPQVPQRLAAFDHQASRGWGLLSDLASTLRETDRDALHRPEERSVLAELAGLLAERLAGGWSEADLRAHLAAPLPQACRSVAKLLRSRTRKLDAVAPDPERLRATAAAQQRAAVLGWAEAEARSLAGSGEATPDVVGELVRRYEGEALERALAVVERLRSRQEVAAAVTGLVGVEYVGGAERERPKGGRRVQDGTELAGPTAVGDVLGKLVSGSAA